MNTPDTEWESLEETAKRILKLAHDYEYPLNLVIELLSARDTYWKERVRKEVEKMKEEQENLHSENENCHPTDCEHRAIDWALDTLLDNLK